MIFLILESLGSTELGFILVMALIFFGPRKLPQLSRTIGKNLASFRRASEDFKSTWEKEVNLEEFNLTRIEVDAETAGSQNSILNDSKQDSDASSVNTVDAEMVVPRQSRNAESVAKAVAAQAPVEAPSKRDWL
jgi:Sec-independent protein translocase protein TatA